MRVSRLIIYPYCLFFGLNADYLNQFESESGETSYFSYADFFKRKFKVKPVIESAHVWPCEGYVCDWGLFSEKNNSMIKGQKLDLNAVFHSRSDVTKKYFFTNIFLHNHNYHRVHAPIDGTITKISFVPGDLVFLRPWFYKRADVSYPAIRNERVIFEITDVNQNPWYMALVGGFGVGAIEISDEIKIGTRIQCGQEVAKFNLGSTVCLASPDRIEVESYLQIVKVGQKLNLI